MSIRKPSRSQAPKQPLVAHTFLHARAVVVGVVAALLCLIVGAGCGSSPNEAAPSVASATGSRYAISADVFSTDFSNRTSLLWLVDDLGGGAVDAQSAVELPGGATIWGVPGSGSLYVVSAEALTISKYRVTEGKLRATGERIGLLGAGITTLVGPQMVFDGPSRAFFLDMLSARALELDLEAMRIGRTVDLSAAAFEPTKLSSFGQSFAKHGDRYVTTVFSTTPTYDRVDGTSKLLFFDARDGSFETKEVPCGGLQYSVQASNGDIFFSADPYVASVHLLDPTNPAPCMIRLPAATDEPDEANVRLNDLTGRPTGGLIAGPNETALLRVLDTTTYSPSPGATYAEPFAARRWQTWRIRLGDPTSAEPTDRAPVAGGIKAFSVDGEVYENDSAADFSSTTLVRTTGENAPAPGLKMPGVVWGIVRVL